MWTYQKTDLREYVKINKNGKFAIKFKIENDELVSVRPGTTDSDIILISNKGFASRFSCDKFHPQAVTLQVYGELEQEIVEMEDMLLE